MDESNLITEVSTYPIIRILYKKSYKLMYCNNKAIINQKSLKKTRTCAIEHYEEHLLWHNNKCTKVLYSDSNKTELNSNSRKYVQKPVGTRNNSK